MITMSDIAKITGVSQATVSRVLSGNTRVKPEVRQRVLACAKEHNYVPNMMAQSLVKNRTLLLGVIVTDISNPFFADIVKSIESYAGDFGYSLMLFNSDYNLEKERNFWKLLKRYKVDGVLLVPNGKGEEYEQETLDYDVPVVAFTRRLESIDSVSVSHYEAGKKVAHHLLQAGYGSFVYVGDEDDDKERGYIEVLEQSGISIDECYLSVRNREVSQFPEIIRRWQANKRFHGGIGIFAYNDLEALIVLEKLKEMKLKLPDEVALVGFDNTIFGKHTTPTLTSVTQPVDEIGRLAISRLIERIEGAADKPLHFQLEARIIARESSIGAATFD